MKPARHDVNLATGCNPAAAVPAFRARWLLRLLTCLFVCHLVLGAVIYAQEASIGNPDSPDEAFFSDPRYQQVLTDWLDDITIAMYWEMAGEEYGLDSSVVADLEATSAAIVSEILGVNAKTSSPGASGV